MSNVNRYKEESPYEFLSRFLDSLLEIPRSLRLEDSICIDIFCDIYEPVLSFMPKELKPQEFEHIIDCIRIVEEAKHDYEQKMRFQNRKSANHIEKDQEFSQKMDKDVSEDEHLHNSINDDIAILANNVDVLLKFDD